MRTWRLVQLSLGRGAHGLGDRGLNWWWFSVARAMLVAWRVADSAWLAVDSARHAVDSGFRHPTPAPSPFCTIGCLQLHQAAITQRASVAAQLHLASAAVAPVPSSGRSAGGAASPAAGCRVAPRSNGPHDRTSRACACLRGASGTATSLTPAPPAAHAHCGMAAASAHGVASLVAHSLPHCLQQAQRDVHPAGPQRHTHRQHGCNTSGPHNTTTDCRVAPSSRRGLGHNTGCRSCRAVEAASRAGPATACRLHRSSGGFAARAGRPHSAVATATRDR